MMRAVGDVGLGVSNLEIMRNIGVRRYLRIDACFCFISLVCIDVM